VVDYSGVMMLCSSVHCTVTVFYVPTSRKVTLVPSPFVTSTAQQRTTLDFFNKAGVAAR
jgi:hypothetical protein